ncbi:sporulation protein YpjB [Mesobacillus harenae]|uniref:sporulation protein YpjB n=1 Tax=Mesobacillus harenae TaxID=2213203 RepID=UPI0015812195|nr:sporulation protein YpjB [Mesobacillus harenae]
MKTKIMILFSVLLLLAPLSPYAEKKSPVEKLDNLSNEALQMVKLHRYSDARKLLDYFSEQFLAAAGQDRPFTMDELRIITVSHNHAVEAAVSASMDHDERMNRITQFRLVIDAVSSTHQPLWAELEGPIMNVFMDVKEAAGMGDNIRFEENLDSFLALYNVIHPSMKIDLTPEQVQRIDARINFLDHYRSQVLAKPSSQKELDAIEGDLKKIFDQMTEDEADPSLWWVIISTGSLIILTLSYVGWRKYKGDREKLQNRKKERKY